eukprot:1172870-Karenia_brevis.AAC.1
MVMLAIFGDGGIRWWAGVGAGALLCVGFHLEDIRWESGRFIPACEIFSRGMGLALGGDNGWKA